MEPEEDGIHDESRTRPRKRAPKVPNRRMNTGDDGTHTVGRPIKGERRDSNAYSEDIVIPPPNDEQELSDDEIDGDLDEVISKVSDGLSEDAQEAGDIFEKLVSEKHSIDLKKIKSRRLTTDLKHLGTIGKYEGMETTDDLAMAKFLFAGKHDSLSSKSDSSWGDVAQMLSDIDPEETEEANADPSTWLASFGKELSESELEEFMISFDDESIELVIEDEELDVEARVPKTYSISDKSQMKVLKRKQSTAMPAKKLKLTIQIPSLMESKHMKLMSDVKISEVKGMVLVSYPTIRNTEAYFFFSPQEKKFLRNSLRIEDYENVGSDLVLMKKDDCVLRVQLPDYECSKSLMFSPTMSIAEVKESIREKCPFIIQEDINVTFKGKYSTPIESEDDKLEARFDFSDPNALIIVNHSEEVSAELRKKKAEEKAKEAKEAKEAKVAKDAKEAKDAKDAKVAKVAKDAKVAELAENSGDLDATLAILSNIIRTHVSAGDGSKSRDDHEESGGKKRKGTLRGVPPNFESERKLSRSESVGLKPGKDDQARKLSSKSYSNVIKKKVKMIPVKTKVKVKKVKKVKRKAPPTPMAHESRETTQEKPKKKKKAPLVPSDSSTHEPQPVGHEAAHRKSHTKKAHTKKKSVSANTGDGGPKKVRQKKKPAPAVPQPTTPAQSVPAPTVPTVPTTVRPSAPAPAVPSVPTTARPSAPAPAVPTVPTVPTVPSVPTTARPSAPAVPTVPSVPSAARPSAPAPAVPTVPSVPTTARPSAPAPAVPKVPTVPTAARPSATAPAVPTVPTVPTTARTSAPAPAVPATPAPVVPAPMVPTKAMPSATAPAVPPTPAPTVPAPTVPEAARPSVHAPAVPAANGNDQVGKSEKTQPKKEPQKKKQAPAVRPNPTKKVSSNQPPSSAAKASPKKKAKAIGTKASPGPPKKVAAPPSLKKSVVAFPKTKKTAKKKLVRVAGRGSISGAESALL